MIRNLRMTLAVNALGLPAVPFPSVLPTVSLR